MNLDKAIEAMNVDIDIKVHGGNKCPRCWHYHYLSETPDNLCDRCMSMLKTDYPEHEMVAQIHTYYEKERVKYGI